MSDSLERALILVVDDDKMMRLLVSEVLLREGFDVVEAVDGPSALALYQDREPDAVLLDVMMPGLDGYEVCRRIRCLLDTRSVPILMMTGRDDVESIDAAYDAGATDFVPKPVPYSLLPHRVRYLLRVSQALRREREAGERLARAQRAARLVQWEHVLADGSFHWSEEVTEIFGIARNDGVPGVNALLRWVHPEDVATVKQALASFTPHRLDYRMVLPDGRERIVHHEAEWVDSEGRVAPRLVGAIQDMTERWLAERRAAQLAYYDPLTGLPNHTFLRNYLTRELSAPERGDQPLALLTLQMHGVNRLSDLHGQATGDQLISEVVARLRECVPKIEGDDSTLLTRTGADEFSVVLSKQVSADSATQLARTMLERLAINYSLPHADVVLSSSVGIALHPEAGRSAEQLLQHAGAAMRHAREAGKDQCQVFVQAVHTRALRRMQMELGLRAALAIACQPGTPAGAPSHGLDLHFQPRIALPEYAVTGLEALVRWNAPGLGTISPWEFIPVAEESGAIVQLGEWVLRTACTTVQRSMPNLDVSVNISPRQFIQPGFVALVAEVLQSTGLPPRRLELEITEGVVMHGTEHTHRVMDELKALGVRIVLDDFGTGYSSLNYLVRFPIDTLKIDRSFVVGLPSPRNASVIAAIMALARGLDLHVVVEGVETEEQLRHFVPYGALEIQGYYYSKPRPAGELTEWLASSPIKPLIA
jgi:diguanylate cyclase (GGDEF)-like protein